MDFPTSKLLGHAVYLCTREGELEQKNEKKEKKTWILKFIYIYIYIYDFIAHSMNDEHTFNERD